MSQDTINISEINELRDQKDRDRIASQVVTYTYGNQQPLKLIEMVRGIGAFHTGTPLKMHTDSFLIGYLITQYGEITQQNINKIIATTNYKNKQYNKARKLMNC